MEFGDSVTFDGKLSLLSKTSYKDSEDLFGTLASSSIEDGSIPPRQASGEVFDSRFPGGFVDKPNYHNCQFLGSKFNVSNASYSQFSECFFTDCYFYNCDFRYSYFANCVLTDSGSKKGIDRGNFSFSDIRKTRFENLRIEGVQFRQARITDCTFSSTDLVNIVFEHVDFHGTTFYDVDFRESGVRFCEFTNAKFEQVVFPILDICNNIGVVDILKRDAECVSISTGKDTSVSLNDALDLLPDLVPYYHGAKLYYCLFNALHILGEDDLLNAMLPEAFEYVVGENDFETLLNLCNLLVALDKYDESHLREFYLLIRNLIDPEKLPFHLRKSYLTYMENIKEVLVENPFQQPKATIVFHTNILPESSDRAYALAGEIDKAIRRFDPSLNPTIEVSHHSPYDVITQLCDQLPSLMAICQFFYYVFGGIKSLKDISGSWHEIADNHPHARSQNTTRDNSCESRERHIALSIGSFKAEIDTKYTNDVERMEYFVEKGK